MADQMIRALCLTGGVRILACDIREAAREICQLQQTSPTATIALSRGLTGGALMGALMKDGQRTALKFEGNGPLTKMIVEADYDGAIRGCVGNPAADLPPVQKKWNVSGLIGKAGFLTVSKDLGFGGAPYQGVVQLVSSEIGEDIAYYLTDSEQTPTAVGVTAALGENGELVTAGGFLVQALPKADDDVIEKILKNIDDLPPLATLFAEEGPEGVIRKLFGDIPSTILETHGIFFRCGCEAPKVERALLTLGTEDLQELLNSEGKAEVTCEFCRKAYHFGTPELEALILQASGEQGQ